MSHQATTSNDPPSVDRTASNLSWRVGDVEIVRVEERIHGVVRDTLVPGITQAHLSEHEAWVAPYFSRSGRLLLSVHSFVVKDPDRTIVVDTCSGTEPARPLPGDEAFLGRLESSIEGGLDAVGVVLCTHLHFDHVGWNTRLVEGCRVPTFRNARYLFARRELEELERDDHVGVLEPSVAPLFEAGLVDAVEMDHRLTDRVRLVPTPGHTPGHVSVVIESGGEQAVITGDIAHTPLQFAEPDLTATPFDADPVAATQTRKRFIEERAESGQLVLGTHFPPPTAGWIRRANGRLWFDSSSEAESGSK